MEADGRLGWLGVRRVDDGMLEIGPLNGNVGKRWDFRLIWKRRQPATVFMTRFLTVAWPLFIVADPVFD